MLDNQSPQEKKLWFRPKRYGYGWYPVSWEGWSVLAMYIFTGVSDFFFIDNYSNSVSEILIAWLPKVFILTVFLIIICEARGK